jgi:electron transfer flavoprotein beta subunit
VKIGVCMKQVPSSEARITVSDPQKGIDASVYSRMVMNVYDEFALEEAVQLKERGIATEVIVFTIDGAKVESQLRGALAIGADRAVRIDLEGIENADCLGIAEVLTAALKEEDVQIVMCGKQSMDGDNAQVPAMIAELLDWSQVSMISKLEIDGDDFTAHKDIGGGSQAVIKGTLPAVFSCDKGLNKPRFPKLKQKLAAKKKPIDVKTLSDLGLEASAINQALVEERNWSLPTQRTECKFIDSSDVNAAVSELLSLLKNEAKVL